MNAFVTFSVYITGYASITSSMYLEVKLGIQDRTVFNPPVSCITDLERGSTMDRNETPATKVSYIHTCMSIEIG